MSPVSARWSFAAGLAGIEVSFKAIRRVRKGKRLVREQRTLDRFVCPSAWIEGAGEEHARIIFEEMNEAIGKILTRIAATPEAPATSPAARRTALSPEPMPPPRPAHPTQPVAPRGATEAPAPPPNPLAAKLRAKRAAAIAEPGEVPDIEAEMLESMRARDQRRAEEVVTDE